MLLRYTKKMEVRYIQFALSFFIPFIYYVILFQFVYPLSYLSYGGSDEFLIISNATLLSKEDWSGVISQIKNYYGFGYAIFLTPIIWWIRTPLIRYRAMLCVNAFLLGILGTISFHIANKYFGVNNKNTTLMMSLTVSMFYFNGISASAVTNETPLLLWILIILFYLLFSFKNSDTKKQIYTNTLVLAVLCGYSLNIHTRGLFCIGGAFITIVYIILYYKKSIVNLPIFIVFLGIIYKLNNSISTIIKDILWDGTTLINNTVEGLANENSVFTKFGLFLSKNGIISVLIPANDRLFGIIVTSGGIGLFGLLIGIKLILNKKPMCAKKDKNPTDYLKIASFYIVSMFFTSLLLFSMHCAGRITEAYEMHKLNKWFFYLRYNIIYLIPLFLIAYAYFYNYPFKKYFFKISLIILTISCKYFLISIYSLLGTARYGQKIMYVPYMVFACAKSEQLIGNEIIYVNFIVGCTLIIVHGILLNYRKLKASCMISIVTSMYLFIYALFIFINPESKLYYERVKEATTVIESLVEHYPEYQSKLAFTNISNSIACGIQFFLPDYNLYFDMDEYKDDEMIYITTYKIKDENYDEFLIADNIYIYTKLQDVCEYLASYN